MANTKNNQRTRLSIMLFKNAMMDLLTEKKTVEKITVKELCERAELNRSTFYAHYNEPMDLYIEIENDILEATANHLKWIGEGDDFTAHKFIVSFLEYIKNNDKQFRTLFVEANTEFKSKFIQKSIIDIIGKFNVPLPKDIEQYVLSFVLNGSSGIVIQWIRSDYSIDENSVAELLFDLNENALRAIEKYLL